MIAVLGGLAEVERDLIRTRTAERRQPGAEARAAATDIRRVNSRMITSVSLDHLREEDFGAVA